MIHAVREAQGIMITTRMLLMAELLQSSDARGVIWDSTPRAP